MEESKFLNCFRRIGFFSATSHEHGCQCLSLWRNTTQTISYGLHHILLGHRSAFSVCGELGRRSCEIFEYLSSRGAGRPRNWSYQDLREMNAPPTLLPRSFNMSWNAILRYVSVWNRVLTWLIVELTVLSQPQVTILVDWFWSNLGPCRSRIIRVFVWPLSMN